MSPSSPPRRTEPTASTRRSKPAGSSPCPTSPGEQPHEQRAGRAHSGVLVPTAFVPSCPSVATCLGAKTVAARALECARECQVISQVVQDSEAVRALEQFLGERG